MNRVAAIGARASLGALLAGVTVSALGALPAAVAAAAIVVIGLTLRDPVAGLTAAVALSPAGLLLAPPPARVAELLVWAFISAWLLALWRPLRSGAPDGAAGTAPAFVPALLFALVASASWLAHTIGGSGGIAPIYLPIGIARAIPLDHLVFSSPEPETFTLLPLLAGIALFTAALVATGDRGNARFRVAAALAGSAAALAVFTTVAVLRQWAGQDFGGWFLLRYVRGERYSLHIADLNAAGSHYVLGLLAAIALATLDRPRRYLWGGLAAAILPALWISGSRSASAGALLVGAVLILITFRGIRIHIAAGRGAVLAAAATVGLAIAVAAVVSRPAEPGTAANALRLRAQFLVTSARMFASAPVFGVGIGHYHERSNEFMPPALKSVYGHENAHNYFAQQFAELGLVGGALFVWLVTAVLAAASRTMVPGARDTAALALLAGTAGYVLTCLTGHPLLVPEAAMPFWGAFGTLAAGALGFSVQQTAARRADVLRRSAIAAALVVAGANVALQTRRYALTSTPPGERGFYALEAADDGRPFVWMTRHGVFYVGPHPGTVTIPVRAPGFLTRAEQFFVSVEVAGERVGVYEALPDRWTTIEIPVRRPASAPFRRIDLRANRSWSPLRDRGAREDDQPRSVMVGETRWTPAGGR